jgi:hypothetical protein
MHAEVGLIRTMIANIQAAIAYVRRAEEQLPKIDRWRVLVGYICERITGQTILPTPPPALAGGWITAVFRLNWLMFDWTGSGTASSPRARATFGIYKSPLIYRRENY